MEEHKLQEKQTTSTTSSSHAKKTKQAFLLGIGVFVVVLLVGGVLYVRNGVQQGSENSMVVSLSRVFGMPVARVNGENVLYADYIEDKKTLTQFYASEPTAPAVTETEVSDQVLARLVANELIGQIAKEWNVSVTKEDVETAKAELLTQFPSEEALANEIEARYGWNFDTYVNRVVRPVVLEQKLSEAYVAANVNPEEVKAKAESVLTQILEGEEFAPLAAEYGSDGTKFQGGDLGYFTRGVMVPEFEEAVFSLEPGTVSSELVETSFGYHIVKVEDKRTTTTPSGEEVEEVRARHILFQTGGTEDFITFMDEQFANAHIEVLLNINNPFAHLTAPVVNQVPVENETNETGTEVESES